MRRTLPRPALALLALTAAVGAGCAPSPEPVVVLDLAAGLAGARVRGETGEFVFGVYELEPRLGTGWRPYGEVDRERDRTFRWGRRPRSELEFEVLTPRPVTLRLAGLPAPPPLAPRRIAVEVEGHPVASFEVGPGWREYEVAIPPERLQRGRNRLSLVYDPGADPVAAGGGEGLPNLAMAWYHVAFDGLAPASHRPHADEQGRLFVPFGARVAWPLRLPPGARLESGPARLTSAAAGRLEVAVEVDGAPLAVLESVTGGEKIDLGLAPAGEPALVSLTAIAAPEAPTDAAAGRPAGFLVAAPRIFAPRPAPAAEVPRPRVSRPDVLIYLVDTLRADRLGCYGHEGGLTPHIDRFAAGATVFENARAQASWTLPAVTSVFTGVWPPAHGLVMPRMRLPDEALTMAEIFQAEGYATAAIVANGQITAGQGLSQGFDQHFYLQPGGRDSGLVFERSVEWLATRDRSRPFFLYVHTLDPHSPYLPKEEFRRRFAPGSEEVYAAVLANPKRSRWEPEQRDQVLALYDALVAQNDDAFGRTLDHLKDEDLFEDALIVFLADHGEEFYEHLGWGHGANLYAPAIDVPLILKLPRQSEGRRVGRVAQQVDLLPTLLDYLGLEAPHLEGRSLLAEAMGRGVAAETPPVFSHTQRFGNETHAVIDGGWKYVERRKDGEALEMLFAWDRDRLDRESLAGERPIRAEVLRRLLELRRNRRPLFTAGEADLSDEALEDLRALGYIE